MSFASLNVCCPQCGTAMTTTTAGHTVDDDRLKGTTADCRDCDASVELYYY